ncbi:MAG: preprotein translocase subunit SecY [Candidatus Aenigmarchaeota archaeon CG_4_10_14_3_um_filter_37_21]|nr:MAG: preprotein translocase subunit SecY [Candidatus Aenigmarchaeota archaeon CG_4_10_14_3_um_filter_37_21]
MSMVKFDITKLAKFLPTVEKPVYKQSLNKKLAWTGLVLIVYFLMSSQLFGNVYGVSPDISSQFKSIQMLFGSEFGTLMTVGIGPLVNASIILQLLVGSKIINWDQSDPDDKKKYEVTQKVLSIAFCFLMSFAFVIGGAVPPVNNALPTILLVVLQLGMGGLIVMFLDEIVSKYGVGSGISLFIAAGVIKTIFIGLFSPCIAGSAAGCVLFSSGNPPIGHVWSVLLYITNSEFGQIIIPLLPIITTLVVFFIIIFAQGIAIEIPLAFSAVRGFGRRWELKLFYTSNIPVILTAAMLSMITLVGGMAARPTLSDPNMKCGFMGCIETTQNGDQPVSGLVYYLSAPRNLLMDAITGIFTSKDLVRALTYLTFMVTVCVVFSVFWISTSGMDAESIANQLIDSGMQIPGYRRDPKIIKGVLNRYIPPLAVLGGASIGLLASFADFTGALGTGTGILLTVTIIYQFYEQLKNERTDEAHPIVRKILEG